jgi:large subunit ribosomal protein L4
MAEINVLNSKFEAASKLNTNVSLTEEDIKVPVVHQVVKALLAKKRQGTAMTKNKAKVSGGGIKPFKQKGTGRARQGSSRSPLMVGGGTAFGPTPRDYTQKVNKKMMTKALQSVLADKLNSGKLTVLDNLESNGKTKEMNTLLSGKGLLPCLVVTNDSNSNALKAVRNLQYANGVGVDGFNIYDALKYENLIIEQQALEKLLGRLG